MKKTHYVFSLLAAVLFASCSGNGSYGHAMVRTKAAPAPAVAVPARPHPLPHSSQPTSAPEKPTAMDDLIRAARQRGPRALQPKAAAPAPAAPPTVRVVPLPQNNTRMQTRDYPVMPGQNRGLKRIRSCAY